MRVYCRFIWNYENYHLSLYRVFHGIRLLRLRRLVVVRQSIFFYIFNLPHFSYLHRPIGITQKHLVPHEKTLFNDDTISLYLHHYIIAITPQSHCFYRENK